MPEFENKRKSERKPVEITSFIRKTMPDGNQSVMQFISKDLSEGGVFIVTEDLTVFDLNEEIELMVNERGEEYYEGRAKIVRSVRIFSDEDKPVESGYVVMFLDKDERLDEFIMNKLKSQ